MVNVDGATNDFNGNLQNQETMNEHSSVCCFCAMKYTFRLDFSCNGIEWQERKKYKTLRQKKTKMSGKFATKHWKFLSLEK